MLLSFPHMGKLHLTIAETCRLLDIPVFIPSLPGPACLKLGQDLAPEASCLPFCLVLGNMREALEAGADTLLMLGGSGPCRFGYFVYLAEKILRDAGYSFRLLAIDHGRLLEDYRFLQREPGFSWLEFLRALSLGWQKLSCEEYLDRLERELLPAVAQPDALREALHNWRGLLRKDSAPGRISFVRQEAKALTEKMPRRPAESVLRVGLVGDIYTMLEPFANFRLEELLLGMNVSIIKEMAVSRWFPNTLLPWRRRTYKEGLLNLAYPYLRDTVGGFGLESVAYTRKMGMQAVDGVIQLFPLGCMPEIVARSALNKICREEEIPVLSITVDQHECNAGFTTRIEAFLEMSQKLKARRQRAAEMLTGSLR